MENAIRVVVTGVGEKWSAFTMIMALLDVSGKILQNGYMRIINKNIPLAEDKNSTADIAIHHVEANQEGEDETIPLLVIRIVDNDKVEESDKFQIYGDIIQGYYPHGLLVTHKFAYFYSNNQGEGSPLKITNKFSITDEVKELILYIRDIKPRRHL